MSDEPKGLMVMRHLPVKLDDYRERALSHEMAEARREEMRITDQLKRIQDSYKAQIKDAQNRLTNAAEAITNGFEMKEVGCRQEIDFATNTIRVYRVDTDEKIEERALEPKEREHFRKHRVPVPNPNKEASHVRI